MYSKNNLQKKLFPENKLLWSINIMTLNLANITKNENKNRNIHKYKKPKDKQKAKKKEKTYKRLLQFVSLTFILFTFYLQLFIILKFIAFISHNHKRNFKSGQ